MRVGLSAGLDSKHKKERDRTGHGLRKPELPALAAQGPEAKNTKNPRDDSRRSPEKRQTQRCTTLEKLNAV